MQGYDPIIYNQVREMSLDIWSNMRRSEERLGEVSILFIGTFRLFSYLGY